MKIRLNGKRRNQWRRAWAWRPSFGGGGHNFGGGHSFGGFNRHSSSSGSSGGGGIGIEAAMDLLHSSSVPPSVINGIYSFTGSEMSFRTQVDLPQNVLLQQGIQQQQMNTLMMGDLSMQHFTQMPMQQFPQTPTQQFTSTIQTVTPLMPQPMMMNNNAVVQHLNVHLIGNKTKTTNNCCYLLTICAGSCCYIPLCFMCCLWWKKIVYPRYELSVQAYRDIATLTQRHPTANNLTLTVMDSAFNAQKARILFDALSRGQITAFTFENEALACNGQFNEIDDFSNNMTPIKSLTNVASSIKWGSVII